MEYILNTESAKAADNINSRIDATGKYLGLLTRAEPITSQKGSKGVDMSFRSNDGATADYLTLWTHNADGKELHGLKVLMAIMTCLRVKALKSEIGEIEKYDNDLKKRTKIQVPLFRDLMGKPVGLLLQMEEYAKTAGGTAWKPIIFAAFDKDEFTASEILSKAHKQEKLALMVSALRDRPLVVSSSQSTPAQAAPVSKGNTPFDDMEDDIPF